MRKALAKLPADRYATAAGFARALDARESATSPRRDRGDDATATGGASPGLAPPVRWPPLPSRSSWLAPPLPRVPFAGPWSTADAGGVTHLAVLPFENLGQADDEYFADGLTDAVRGKLAALDSLQVTARSSSFNTSEQGRPRRRSARELGRRVSLTGTVRWVKAGAVRGRVRVSPELVRVAGASTRWQQPFDAALTDVFKVQAEVASRVAQALGVAILAASSMSGWVRGPPRMSPPTTSTSVARTITSVASGARTSAIARQMLERAVALDSAFAVAWAELSVVRAAQYWFFHDRTEAALASAKAAADQALRQRPDLPEGHLALGYYWYWGGSTTIRRSASSLPRCVPGRMTPI